MGMRSLEIVSSNTDITPTPRGAVFRRADGVYVIGRRVEQTKPVNQHQSATDEKSSFRYFGMHGSRLRGRSRVIKETRTQPAERTGASGLEYPAAWAGSYATWERQGPNWSRSVERVNPNLTPISYKAQDYASWEQLIRKELLSNG